MTAALEIRDRAQLFGWETYSDERRREDTFLHGENMVLVSYRKGGTVDRADRYLFYRVDKPQLQETAPARNKKTAVVAWLAELGG